MHSGNFNRYFSVYSNRCTQRTEDDRTVRKVLYAYDRDSSLIRVELPEGRTIRYVYDSADRPVCRLEEDMGSAAAGYTGMRIPVPSHGKNCTRERIR